MKSVTDFIRNLLGDTHFEMYTLKKEKNTGKEKIEFHYRKRPFYHLFVWAIFMNRKDLANIFLAKDTDYTASALFGSAILKELADRAFVLNHFELCDLLKENAGYFETLACNLMKELYRNERDRALKIVVNIVPRYNCTPIAIASSQNMMNFMATSACQAKLNRIWRGNIALHTPEWRIWMTVLLPGLITPKFGFISYEKKGKNSRSVKPSKNDELKPVVPAFLPKSSPNENKGNCGIFSCFSWFYSAPEVKFILYMITYFTFVVIFSIFVLTDLHPLSESLPSVFEYMTWMWTLSLATEEIRQILQTNKGSFTRNIMFWAKNVWNIFDALMYLLFFVSVMLRCVLKSDDFYYARMSYAITLAMFIFRTMQFFFVTRYLGPKVAMIGKMVS
ncbi:unnamed protein product [Mytilus coruscus]|uniref:TRPM-like domain-containing protein n=1 Tax=Mytilus coruscus TaxID=42192 RepID=A0A6J8B628_MYTCO|nr:unnamed protein product [Mytilus coruscus]